METSSQVSGELSLVRLLPLSPKRQYVPQRLQFAQRYTDAVLWTSDNEELTVTAVNQADGHVP